MLLLDTNVISDAMSAKPSDVVRRWFAHYDPKNIWVSSLSKAELLYGQHCMADGQRKEALGMMIAAFFERSLKTEVLGFEDADTPFFALIGSQRRASGRPISQFDNQIAAIARRRGLAIATRNVRDFADCGIAVINPWEAV